MPRAPRKNQTMLRLVSVSTLIFAAHSALVEEQKAGGFRGQVPDAEIPDAFLQETDIDAEGHTVSAAEEGSFRGANPVSNLQKRKRRRDGKHRLKDECDDPCHACDDGDDSRCDECDECDALFGKKERKCDAVREVDDDLGLGFNGNVKKAPNEESGEWEDIMVGFEDKKMDAGEDGDKDWRDQSLEVRKIEAHVRFLEHGLLVATGEFKEGEVPQCEDLRPRDKDGKLKCFDQCKAGVQGNPENGGTKLKDGKCKNFLSRAHGGHRYCGKQMHKGKLSSYSKDAANTSEKIKEDRAIDCRGCAKEGAEISAAQTEVVQ